MSPIRSISQAIAILRLVGQRGPLSLSEVAGEQQISPSSCLAILRTLVAEGALARDVQTKRYSLTREWAGSPFSGDRHKAVIERLRPAMLQLSKACAATVGLWEVTAGRRVRLVAHVENDAPVRIQLKPGQRQPLGGGAIGRMLAVTQDIDEAELSRRFAETRWERPMTLAEYKSEVEDARKAGFALDDGMLHAGICSVGVVLGPPFAGYAISASTFAGARSAQEKREMGEYMANLLRDPG